MKSQHAATNQIRQHRKKLHPVTDHKCARLKRGETELNGNWGRFLMRTMLGLTLTSGLLTPIGVHAQSLADYTSIPSFIANTVTPNILFMVDLSEAMLPASYGNYPESSGGKISSNIDGTGLCNTNTDTSTNPQPSGCPSVNVAVDTFSKRVSWSPPLLKLQGIGLRDSDQWGSLCWSCRRRTVGYPWALAWPAWDAWGSIAC